MWSYIDTKLILIFMDKLHFGTAGVPASSKKSSTVHGIKRVAELDLDCMEIEFVYGVRMGAQSAEKVNQASLENSVRLSVHAPYYVNLNSKEEEKRKKSIERIVKSSIVGKACGADRVTFHPAFYHDDEVKCYDNVLKSMHEILEQSQVGIKLCPETTGKLSAFGTISELLRLASDLPGIGICVDFAHVYSRSLGKINSYKGFAKIIEKIYKKLPDYGENVYFHVSGIDYGPRGELKHLPLEESNFNWQELLQVFRYFDLKGIVICESPVQEYDALKLKQYYRRL